MRKKRIFLESFLIIKLKLEILIEMRIYAEFTDASLFQNYNLNIFYEISKWNTLVYVNSIH